MAEVKILIEGYTSADAPQPGDQATRPTVTLVKDGSLVMVVDPGVLEDPEMLTDALRKEGLAVDDVNIVCVTHSHLDHYRNVGLFPKAKALEYWGVWDKNVVEEWEEAFTTDIKILKTPGHNYDCISLLVKTDRGIVAIVGDLFWKENSPINDPYATDKKKLEENRTKILGMADWIIPGHGKMYKTGKNQR